MKIAINVMILTAMCFCGTVFAAVGWEDNFNPIKSTWVQTTAVWTDNSGPTATLTENDPTQTYGLAQSEVITLDVSIYRELVVAVTGVQSGALYTIQIQEVGGVSAYANAVSYEGNPGTYVVDIAKLMSWSGTKSFQINIWIDGDNTSVTFDLLQIRQSADTAWSENFDPIKITWLQDSCTWTDTAGPTAVLKENNPSVSYGVVKSEMIVADVNEYSLLYVKTTAVDSGCLYTVQIEEIAPSPTYANAISYIGTPSEHIVDIGALMSWNSLKKFRINIWLEGDNKTVTFDKIELRNKTLQEKPNPILWEDHFDPVKSTWYEIGAVWDDLPGTTANLVEDNPGMTYGKVESETLMVNLDVYPELTVDVTYVDAGGWLDVGIQEQGGSWTYQDVTPTIIGPTRATVNIAQAMGWSGYKSFRIIFWINGNTKYATLDVVRLAMDCGRDVQPGDYNEDCSVNLLDLVVLSQQWLNAYGIPDLEEVSDHWLQETF
jgi:hypothetical protein